jgi:nitroreductase
MEFKQLLTGATRRNSSPQAVPEETIQELLEMTRLAPSGLNVQPWRIKVISDADMKATLSPATHDETQINSCSHLLVFCVDTDWEAQTQRLSRAMKERTIPDMIWGKVMGIAGEMARAPADLQAWLVGQVYISATYALLGAQTLGLDCCPMTHFDVGEYSRILGLPRTSSRWCSCRWLCGRPPRPKWRYPLEEVLI